MSNWGVAGSEQYRDEPKHNMGGAGYPHPGHPYGFSKAAYLLEKQDRQEREYYRKEAEKRAKREAHFDALLLLGESENPTDEEREMVRAVLLKSIEEALTRPPMGKAKRKAFFEGLYNLVKIYDDDDDDYDDDDDDYDDDDDDEEIS